MNILENNKAHLDYEKVAKKIEVKLWETLL